MSKIVVGGAELICPFGAPKKGTLKVAPTPQVESGKGTVATIMDFAPLKNVPKFGNCTSPTNPQVIAAQGAPQPCLPVITSPWTPGSPTVQVGDMPALTSDSTCLCTWGGGVISVNDAKADVTTG
jgi:hypothetical protein